MEQVFITLLNASITAGYLVLAVLLLRSILKKAPKFIRCILWGLVGIRLVLPFSLESILSLIPSAEPIPPEIVTTATPTVQTGLSFVNHTVNPILIQSMAPAPTDTVTPMQIFMGVAWKVWLMGMVAMVIYSVVSFLLLKRKLREGVTEGGNIWLCDRVSSPFLLGLIRPRIYLPSDLADADKDYVLAHERAHIRRKDHWWKPLGFLLLTVYWFNPLMWVAYIFLCRDIEFACDEKVIKELGDDHKASYSQSLIRCSVPKKMISACPVAFGEDGVKGRIKSVLNYKKPAFWIILIAISLCIVVAVCFLTNPPKTEEPQNTPANEYRFRATVVEIYEDSLLVEPLERWEYFSGAQQVIIRLNGRSPEDYRLGCIVEVLFDSQIQETMPPIIPNASTVLNLDLLSSHFPIPHYSFTATITEVLEDCIVVKYQHFPLHNFEFSYYQVNIDPADFSVGDKVEIAYDGQVTNAEPYDILGKVYDTEIIDFDDGEFTDNDFNAIVLEVNEDSLLVEPDTGEDELAISNRFLIPVDSPAKYNIGDYIKVLYDGNVEHSNPAIISNIIYVAHVASDSFFVTDQHGTASYAAFDIDSDGITEDCYVYRHPLTGVAVIILCAYEKGVLEYCNYFYPGNHYEFSFQDGENGQKVIAAKSPILAYPSEYFTISVQGFNLVLTNNGKQVDYWSAAAPFQPTLHTVKEKYPHFFGLSTFKGLEVYVWKNGDWRCGVRGGTNRNVTPEELQAFGQGASLPEMAVILSTYGITKDEVFLLYDYDPASPQDTAKPPAEGVQEHIEQILFTFLPERLSSEPYIAPEFQVQKPYKLIIYAYKMSENGWRFQFYEKTTIAGSAKDAAMGLNGLSLEDAKKRLAQYALSPEEIPVIPIGSYISSYYYEINEQTAIEARKLLGLT